MKNKLRTMFFVPGNSPKKIAKAEIYGADSIIYDLEDSVSVYEKDAARDLISCFLQEHRPDAVIGIRINPMDTPYFEEDMECVVPLCPDFLRVPKAEKAEDIIKIDEILTRKEKELGLEVGKIKIVATIETALGVYNAFNIAKASTRVIAVGLGAEDFCADMGMKRSENGEELAFARNYISLSAHAAGVMPADYVNSNFADEEAFLEDVRRGKQMGFAGKSCIHPNQIPLIHSVYTPTEKEIAHARDVVRVYEEAMRNASGVVALNGKMVDMPVVIRAKELLASLEE